MSTSCTCKGFNFLFIKCRHAYHVTEWYTITCNSFSHFITFINFFTISSFILCAVWSQKWMESFKEILVFIEIHFSQSLIWPFLIEICLLCVGFVYTAIFIVVIIFSSPKPQHEFQLELHHVFVGDFDERCFSGRALPFSKEK